MWAIIRTSSWDSPLSKSLKPDEWHWYGPQSAVVIETRDLLRVISTKMQVHPKVRREHLPKMTVPPWQKDAGQERFAPEPVTQDEIDAHLARLNGR